MEIPLYQLTVAHELVLNNRCAIHCGVGTVEQTGVLGVPGPPLAEAQMGISTSRTAGVL